MTNRIIVTEHNRGTFGSLLDEQFRQRRNLFVDELGWDLPSKQSPIETDQYDRPETVYVLIEQDGALIAYARLLPTTTTVSFGSHEFTYLVKDAVLGKLPGIPSNIFEVDQLPNSQQVWEMTRVEARDRVAMKVLFEASNEYLTSVGAKETITFTRQSFASILSKLGFPTEACGPVVEYGGKPYRVLRTVLRQIPDQ